MTPNVRPSLEFVARSLVDAERKYFEIHRLRFQKHLDVLLKLTPQGGTLLDVGSHFLHLASALRHEGVRVKALDVPEFQRLDFVRQRAAASGVECFESGDLASGKFLPDLPNDSLSGVVFSEILEHITFNPVAFWRRIYDLLSVGGFIFISTPNALRLTNTVKTVARLASRSGIGISIDEIFTHVTYGHHWKEYSASEVREYFSRLSPDFEVDVRFVDFGVTNLTAGKVQAWLQAAGNLVPGLRPHLEVVVRLPRKSSWTAVIKNYSQ